MVCLSAHEHVWYLPRRDPTVLAARQVHVYPYTLSINEGNQMLEAGRKLTGAGASLVDQKFARDIKEELKAL